MICSGFHRGWLWWLLPRLSPHQHERPWDKAIPKSYLVFSWSKFTYTNQGDTLIFYHYSDCYYSRNNTYIPTFTFSDNRNNTFAFTFTFSGTTRTLGGRQKSFVRTTGDTLSRWDKISHDFFKFRREFLLFLKVESENEHQQLSWHYLTHWNWVGERCLLV